MSWGGGGGGNEKNEKMLLDMINLVLAHQSPLARMCFDRSQIVLDLLFR